MSSTLAPRIAPALLLMLTASSAWSLPPGFSIQQVHSGVAFPTAMRFAPDGRLFYTELGGRVMVFANAFSPSPTVWATIPVNTAGERGLLGMAFHPDFPDSPFVYLFHSNPSPLVDRVVRLRDQGGIGTGYTILLNNLPSSCLNHHGGRLAFGPDDLLYVTVGDQCDPNNAQTPGSINGKILRLGLTGLPAAGNPFGAGNPAYAMGVRNAFGICFDPLAGTGYWTDPGPECDCEANHLVAGANYGWGPSDFCGGQPAGTKAALWTFASVVTPVGCTVYRGNAYPSLYQGDLFFGAWNNSTLYRMKFRSGTVDQVDSLQAFAQSSDNLLDVTGGPDGALWFCTSNAIYRILARGTVGVDSPEPPSRALRVGPNPFRGSLSLNASGLPSDASLQVVDLQGRVILTWKAPLPSSIQWDGRGADGRPVPAGVYLIQARGSGFEMMRRVVRIDG